MRTRQEESCLEESDSALVASDTPIKITGKKPINTTVGKDETRQDKTRQDKTRQDKTRQMVKG